MKDEHKGFSNAYVKVKQYLLLFTIDGCNNWLEFTCPTAMNITIDSFNKTFKDKFKYEIIIKEI